MREPEDLHEEIEEMFSALSSPDAETPSREEYLIGGFRLTSLHWDTKRERKESRPRKARGGARPHPPHRHRAEAMRMLAEGVPLKRIPKLIKVSRASLHRWRRSDQSSAR